MQTSAAWVLLSENRAAGQAVEAVRECVGAARPRRRVNPLFLHGPTGTGKSRLLHDLFEDLGRMRPDLSVCVLTASDLGRAEGDDELAAARQAGLVAVEDVQRLPERAAAALAALIDRCVARQVQIVLTATTGPALLPLPGRLTSRLAGGLVVGLELFGPASRREFLRHLADKRGLATESAVLDWLAEHTPGSARQLEGALTRLAELTRSAHRTPTLAEVTAVFREDAQARRLTVEHIVQRVGRHFQIEPARLRSAGRTREVLLPRQVGMYLARQLTALSLEQIGAYFGGRDHSTVLHACRKVERALASDAGLSGAVRSLRADLC